MSTRIPTNLIKFTLVSLTILTVAIAYSNVETSARRRPARGTDSQPVVKLMAKQKPSPTPSRLSLPRAKNGRAVQQTSIKNLSETTRQIMQREEATRRAAPSSNTPEPERELTYPDRRVLPQNPDSPNTPPPSALYEGAPSALDTQAAFGAQVAGTNFTAATHHGVHPTGAYPPDSMGAVGPAQYVLAVNGRIVTFDKNTGAADNVLDTTTNNFFQSVRDGAGTADPRIRYDRLTSRWFLVMINTSLPNRILLAVSDEAGAGVITADTVWAKTYLTVPPAPSGNCFADFPTLGIDANALYIGTNTFCPGFISMDGYVVRKATTLDIGPVLYFTFTELSLIYPNADGSFTFTPGPFTPQGVDNFDQAAAEGYFIGVDNASKGKLMLLRVNDPGGTPAVSGNIPITVNATSFPITVPHLGNALGNELGSPGRLSAVGDRLSGAVIRNGRLWTAHNIAVTNTGVVGDTPTRDGARWYEIQNLNATPSVAQWSTIFTRSDQNSTDQRYYWIPSIMVSGQGHAVIGFSTAGRSEYVNAAFAGRLAGDAPGTMRTPTLYTNSTTAYNPEGDGHDDPEHPIRRWGDYSYTSLDPLDDMTMWTVQEFCNATNSYGVRVVKLIAPPPAAPALASPAQVPLGQDSINVTINGAPGNGSGFYDPGVDLPAPAPPFKHIDASVTGGVVVNSVTYHSPTSLTLNLDTTGATSGAQSVTVVNPDGQSANGIGILFVGQPTPSPTPLAPPSDLSAEAEPHAPAAIRLNWTDNSTGEDGFIVERRVEQCAAFEDIVFMLPNTETYLDTEVLSGTRYEYQVRAFIGGVAPSEPSNTASALTSDHPQSSERTRLVSRSALTDVSGDGSSNSPAMTPDGRFVAFVSSAKNLHEKDQTMKSDIYVRDMETGVTELISVNTAGEHSNGISNSPAISADGRYVVFVSNATNLGGNNLSRPGRDVFVRDRVDCATRLVSVNAQGVAGNGASFAPVISANGAAIAFVSNAKNLAEQDGEKKADVYVYFTSTGEVELVSFNRHCNGSSDGVSKDPLLNDDGTLLVFMSTATNLDEAGKDIFSNQDIFLRDLTRRCTDNNNDNHVELVSVNGQGLHSGNGDSNSPSMSANGRRIAFVSTGSDLGLDQDVKPDVFMRDMNTNTTTLVSVNKDGSGSGNGASNSPVISGDGHFVAFVSTATNLTDLDKESKKDLFLRSLDADASTELISIANTSKSANGISNSPVISYDGRFVAFVSTGTNLLTNLLDTNSAADVFLRDRLDQTTEPISLSAPTDIPLSPPRTANGISNSPLISQGGGFVVFVSTGRKVTYNDLSHASDLFRRSSLRETNSPDAGNPTIQFSEPVYTVGESAQSVAITVTRDAAFGNTPMSVNYATGGGTASPGADYLAASGTLTFSNSETSKTFTVPILDDASDERDEVFNLMLSDPSGGASLGSPHTAILTIEDDDAPPKVSVADVTLTEPTHDTAHAAFTVKLSAPSEQPITIDYETADGTAHAGGDYQHAGGTLTFAPNETFKEVRVNVNSDALAEGNETFFLNLSNAPLTIISDGQGVCTITTSGVLISEFRFRGPTPADPDAGDGSLDEFIEIYNATGAPLTVAAADESAGWALAALNADGETATTLAVIPNNTVIPAKGHYLVVNKDVVNNTGGRYSLGAYATGDNFYTQDIPDSSGIALFATANAESFNPATRLDAVGFDSLSGDFANLFREGSGLPSVGTSDGEYSFARSLNTGVPQDTNNNEQDFIFVSTDGERYGGVSSILGAPGPENMSSGVQHNGTIKASLVDWLTASTAPPNRVRDGHVISEYARFGTLALRRMFTNTTSNYVSQLRFRVVDITTYGSPNVCGGCLQADVRVLNGRTTFNVTRSNGTQALVYGTTVEDVSSPEADFGGGLNRSLSFGTITLDRALAPGASVAVEFLLGVESAGFFRFFVNVEAQQSINENSMQRKKPYNGKRR